MADTQTQYYTLVKPENTASNDTWGIKTNNNWNIVDTALHDHDTVIAATAAVAAAALPKAGGAVTGVLSGVAAVTDADIPTLGQVKALILAATPIYQITMWGGSIANIPTGFALCNGQTVNGRVTPNLQDKFVIGSGLNYGVGAIGGTTNHDHGGVTGNTYLSVDQIPSHTHSVYDPGHAHSISDPSHAHAYVARTGNGNGQAAYGAQVTGINDGTFATDYRTTGIGIYGAGTGISIYANGGGNYHNHSIAAAYHMPPFYALAFIMKVA